MTLADVAKQRLINQQLLGTSFQSATELVGWFGAVQAQEYAQTKWGLGLRLRHLFDKDVEQDFAERRILRTHVLRPTWHFVTPLDIRWMLMLTAPRVHQANAFMYRKLELDKPIFNRCNEIIANTLQGGKCLTRDVINNEFKRHTISAEGFRLSYIMMNAELAGLICSGPRQGNQFTYALLEERVPATEAISRDEALAELTRRYFTSRGPATVNDFATWSGLTLADCRKGLQLLESELVRNTIDRVDHFCCANSERIEPAEHDIHLLPLFDEWIMGYKDRSATFDFRNSLTLTPPFRFGNMIMAEGQIIGTWKRSAGSKSMIIEADFFAPLSERQRNAFDEAVHRLERFINMPVQYRLIQ
ncbi:winged helix DNA-binding domain-containing protein [Spirosoma validum]|uniref:AlkZ family DNA glycosylase n=1 Tax=Spirosoma validum TaxID=2771355 RepID=A0A927B6S9_9BACT|nr:winged helix DNA-binding domain-containing protein [Spirosoma validum]MBD2756343.1 AlkZ family DNA glycosylase [Spirosoma validum]